MNVDDTRHWIWRRTSKEATDGLLNFLAAANSVGFGRFTAEGYRWELGRSIDEDHWEEILIWVYETRSGRIGFKSAHRAIRHVTDRTQTLDEALEWAVPRDGGES